MSTPDVAQRSVPSSAASRARSFNIARGVAAAAAAFVILVVTASVDRLLAVFWRFELAFGFVLQRRRLGSAMSPRSRKSAPQNGALCCAKAETESAPYGEELNVGGP
jgi:hypothetical protein